MKKKRNWKLWIFGTMVLLLMQSCVVVRKTRHHHHHRHCMLYYQQNIGNASFNASAAYTTIEPAINYERNG